MNYWWLLIGFVLLIIIIVIIRLIRSVREKQAELIRCKEELHATSSHLTQATDDCNAKQGELDRIMSEMADSQEELKALKEQLNEMAYAIQDNDSFQQDYPALGALRDLGMAFPDAECAKKLDDALDDAAICIKTHMAVSTSDSEPMQEGVEALVLSSFDRMADQVITSASASASYEKCKQDIYLAYYITNLRAKETIHAFITKKYLDAKLEILRWTLVVQEYRRIMREEDKNRRDAERENMRALREIYRREQEAQKEKEMYERALQQARLAINVSVSFQEKERLKARIKELEAQIIAKGDEVRALTAAQQGRSGTVYVISNVGSFGEGIYKIGMTRRLDPQERIDELNEASTPYPFDVHAFIKTPDAPKLEYDLHQFFASQKVNLVAHSNAREFYRVPIDEIKTQVEKMGYSVHWKMQADAQQYIQSERMRMSRNMSASVPENQMVGSCGESANSPENDLAQVTHQTIEQLIHLLTQRNISFVDKRDKGGCLWIESTPECDSLLETISLEGARLIKSAKVRHFNGKPGWYAI